MVGVGWGLGLGGQRATFLKVSELGALQMDGQRVELRSRTLSFFFLAGRSKVTFATSWHFDFHMHRQSLEASEPQSQRDNYDANVRIFCLRDAAAPPRDPDLVYCRCNAGPLLMCVET